MCTATYRCRPTCTKINQQGTNESPLNPLPAGAAYIRVFHLLLAH